MKQIISQSSAGLLLTVLFCAGCDQGASGSRLTPANYDQVNLGMSKTRVEEILGPPTKVEEKQALLFAGSETRWEPVTTYRYEEGKIFVAITFKNNQVDTKDSNLGREP